MVKSWARLPFYIGCDRLHLQVPGPEFSNMFVTCLDTLSQDFPSSQFPCQEMESWEGLYWTLPKISANIDDLGVWILVDCLVSANHHGYHCCRNPGCGRKHLCRNGKYLGLLLFFSLENRELGRKQIQKEDFPFFPPHRLPFVLKQSHVAQADLSHYIVEHDLEFLISLPPPPGD